MNDQQEQIAGPNSEDWPQEARNMVDVSKEDFYRIMGPRNVHPYPQGRWDARLGYYCSWRYPSGAVFGGCIGGTHLCAYGYRVTRAFSKDKS